MPILPLVGHESLRDRLRDAERRLALPASLLLHGPRGVGKQRLGLWLGQLLLCTGTPRPCGGCQPCRYVLELCHPDVHWFFPRPRLKDSDASPEDVREDYGDALAERAAAGGLYAAPGGSEAIYVATVRTLVHLAAMAPALGTHRVFLIGDAERMVPQEGAEAAANAFLKLLEEPPPNTTIVVTSSEPGALLPTIRSRVVSVRVPPLADAAVATFVRQPAVAAALDAEGVPAGPDLRVGLAGGAPGTLIGAGDRAPAVDAARRMLDAAVRGDEAARLRMAFTTRPAGARGDFMSALHALTALLHARARDAAARRDERGAFGASRAVARVEEAKAMASGNVSPQLLSVALLRDLATVLR